MFTSKVFWFGLILAVFVNVSRNWYWGGYTHDEFDDPIFERDLKLSYIEISSHFVKIREKYIINFKRFCIDNPTYGITDNNWHINIKINEIINCTCVKKYGWKTREYTEAVFSNILSNIEPIKIDLMTFLDITTFLDHYFQYIQFYSYCGLIILLIITFIVNLISYLAATLTTTKLLKICTPENIKLFIIVIIYIYLLVILTILMHDISMYIVAYKLW